MNQGSSAAPPPSPAPPPPSPPSPLGTAEPWDLVAAAYTAELVPYFELYARDALARAELPPRPRIADVAAGPGTLSLLAAAPPAAAGGGGVGGGGLGAEVSALDVSPRMVEALRARAAAAGLSGAIDARVGDGQRLPFDGDAYDGAFSLFGLMFFPDRAAGLRELHRVLRPGRRAVVSSWIPFEGPFGALMAAAREVLPGLPFGGDARPPMGDPDDVRREMTAAGFAHVDVDTVVHELSAPGFDAFWDSVERANAPLVLLRHRLGEERWSRMAPVIRERARAAVGDGPLLLARGAYLGVGTKAQA